MSNKFVNSEQFLICEYIKWNLKILFFFNFLYSYFKVSNKKLICDFCAPPRLQVKFGKAPGKGEFERLLSEDRAKHIISKTRTDGQSQENFLLNRFGNILPYNDHRVKLINGGSDRDYINASWIGHGQEYIAAQGPIESTVNDFWMMVAESRAQKIIMLTKTDRGNLVMLKSKI